MRKTDKKVDNQIRLTLTDVCEKALKKVEGFQWLTHQVNYSNFPQSLRITCIFETNEQLSVFSSGENKQLLDNLIQSNLSSIGIKLKTPKRHIYYDSEEKCAKEHNGNWSSRLDQSH